MKCNDCYFFTINSYPLEKKTNITDPERKFLIHEVVDKEK